MSRTSRTGTAEGFWATVDDWAGSVVTTGRLRAWSSSRCRLVAVSGPYLEVTDDLDLPDLSVRPLRDAVAARGVALADREAIRTELAEADVAHRRVDAARRYRWNGPLLTPVVLEVHSSGDEAVVEAWWEDVWAAWPTIRLGRESAARRPPRRAAPIAQIAALFAALGHEPLSRSDG